MSEPALSRSAAVGETEVAPASDPGEWERFVAGAPDGTFCHSAAWRGIMEDVLGHRWTGLVARRGGELTGVLPLVRVRSRLLGDFLVSMPFLNYGGPIGAPEARAALARAACELAADSGVDRLELRCREALEWELAPGRRKITVLLRLPGDSRTLFEDGFRSKLRSQIRRPLKEGMETRFGPEQWEPFYDVFARNMRDLGTPVLPRRFFERIAAEVPAARFGVVYHEGRPVAGGAGFVWGDEYEMTWASALREANRLAPNMLLYWRFMERSIEEGLRVFNFGRCTPGGGTHRFKSQWGGEDVDLRWVQWPAGGGREAPDPERRVFRLAAAAWSRLPLPVANRLGPPLARLLP